MKTMGLIYTLLDAADSAAAEHRYERAQALAAIAQARAMADIANALAMVAAALADSDARDSLAQTVAIYGS